MALTTLFTMKLEPDLHAAFMREAKASDQSAAQIVRDLMREFVAKQHIARAYEEFVSQKLDLPHPALDAGLVVSADDENQRPSGPAQR